MKKSTSIITLLTVAQLLVFYMQSHAQVPIDKCPSVVNSSDSILIADETTLNYTKTGARIHCSNESVFNILYRSHSAMFKRYSCAFKRDRHGWYKDYLIYLSKEDASYIINWAKTNL